MKFLTAIPSIQAEHIDGYFLLTTPFPFWTISRINYFSTPQGWKGWKFLKDRTKKFARNPVSLLFTDRLPYKPITYVLLKKLIRKCENYVANTMVSLPGSILELFLASWELFYFPAFVKGNVWVHWDQNWHSSWLKQTITNFSARLPERNAMQWLREQTQKNFGNSSIFN